MTDKQKLEVINAIVSQACEWEPTEQRGTYYEGVMASIVAVLELEEGDAE